MESGYNLIHKTLLIRHNTDTEKIKELKLTEEDMTDSYFFNADNKATICECNEETVYTFDSGEPKCHFSLQLKMGILNRLSKSLFS